MEFAYYKDLYIENQRNLTDEFIITTPARAPLNYFSNGYMVRDENKLFKTTYPYFEISSKMCKFFRDDWMYFQVTAQSESAFFYFTFDPAIVFDYFKTKLTDEELAVGGRCSHLKKFPEKFQIAECCITDLPEGLRHSDFPKCKFL